MTGPDGLLLVDKPQGLTSHDIVARARRALGTKKVGHAGTLDPMATGLLILGVGRATRMLTYVVGRDKVYEATIRLGQTTITDDAEGEITDAAGASDVDETALAAAVAGLTGVIQQVPSAVSAIKVGGVRSYARVRAGEQVELRPREVTVSRLDVLDRRPAHAEDGAPVLDLDVVVECSSGTYIRAIARDLGAALGTGGHLTRLHRTSIGPVDVDTAVTLEELQRDPQVVSLADAARSLFPVVQLDDEPARELRFGRPVPPPPGDGVWAAFWGEAVLALIERRGGQGRPLVVFDPA